MTVYFQSSFPQDTSDAACAVVQVVVEDQHRYRESLWPSAFKPKVIRTLAATVGRASSRGTTSVDRMTIAKVVFMLVRLLDSFSAGALRHIRCIS